MPSKKCNILWKYCILIICLCSSAAVFGKSTTEILNHADSLVYEGNFKDVAEYLIPLEPMFVSATEMDKYHYYGLIGAWYIRENDYNSAIPYLEKKAQYNHVNIDDLYFLATFFSSKCLDWEKAGIYARKALLLDDEITHMEFVKDHSVSQTSRLHYILGILSCQSGNRIMAEEHLNWIKNNNPIDTTLVNHLSETITNISEIEPSYDNGKERNSALKLLENSLISTNVSADRIVERYHIATEDELDSIVSSMDIDMIKYLNTVFYIEDSYGESDISKSIFLLKQACQIANSKKFYIRPSLELCELYLRLGRAYYFLRQYETAITWFFLSYENSRKIETATTYNVQALGEIADIYLDKGELYKALIYADEMLDEFIKLKNTTNLDIKTISYISRYANVLFKTGFNVISEKFYRLSIKITPEETYAYKLACNNYATYLFLNNRYDEACYYYLLIKDKFPSSQTISNLSIAYLHSNKIEEAADAYHDYYEKNILLLESVLGNFTEKEWNKFWERFGNEFYISSNYLAYNINTRESLIDGYNATVLSKSLPLLYKIKFNQIFSSAKDPKIHNLYQRYMMYKQNLSKGQNNSLIIGQMAGMVDVLEDSLKQTINLVNQRKKESLINNYDKILNSLTKEEVAIEFCQYLDVLAPLDSLSPKYAAYIISPDYPYPIFKIIGDEIEISNLIYNSQKDEISLNQLYSQNTIGELIWGDLLPYMENKRTIYFSPIGELSVLNHQILKCYDSILGEKYNLRRVSSTSLLADKGDEVYDTYPTVVLYGDINYSADYEDMKAAAKQYNFSSPDFSSIPRGREDRDGWGNLQYSKQEIDSINAVMLKMGSSVSIYCGAKANEESFKALDFNAPSIIHIATHGFAYFNNEEEKRNKIQSVSPHTVESILMSWTGLLFSGANNTWTGKCQIKNFEDGILTANEISLLHLDGAKLVVLSACNTGLGIHDTFGMTIGLQKAFKMAGVKSILMSLWKVPDESTSLLMTKFYEALLSGSNRHDALKIAMQKVREIYPDPYYWGAFVILD